MYKYGLTCLLCLFTLSANAQCNTYFNNVCVTGGSTGIVTSCCVQLQTPPPEPSSSKLPKENIEILLQRAKEDVKTNEAKWFNSGTSLSEAKTKVEKYKTMLKQLEGD